MTSSNQEVATYYSHKKNFSIVIKARHWVVENGKRMFRPGLRATWNDYELKTRDKALIQELDGMLQDPHFGVKWKKRFWRKPSDKAIQAAARIAQETEAAKNQLINEKLTDDEKKQLDNWQKFLQSKKTQLRSGAITA